MWHFQMAVIWVLFFIACASPQTYIVIYLAFVLNQYFFNFKNKFLDKETLQMLKPISFVLNKVK